MDKIENVQQDLLIFFPEAQRNLSNNRAQLDLRFFSCSNSKLKIDHL